MAVHLKCPDCNHAFSVSNNRTDNAVCPECLKPIKIPPLAKRQPVLDEPILVELVEEETPKKPSDSNI